MKKCYCIFSLVLFMCVSLLVLETDIYSAPRKASVKRAGTTKKTSSSSSSAKSSAKKRAATSGKSSSPQLKRAATNGSGNASTRRAASNVKTARAMSRVKGSSAVIPVSTPVQTDSTPESNLCPVGKILQRTSADGVDTYNISKKETCELPEEGVIAKKWEQEKAKAKQYIMTLQVKPTWIALNDAYYLECAEGFIEATVNNVKTCVDYLTVCPLNVEVTKSDSDYIHPNTGDSCNAPDYTYITHPETSWEVPPEDLYIFECIANYYPIATKANENVLVQCVNCPSGSYSPKGAKSLYDCREPCETDYTYVRFANGENKCAPCDSVATTYNATTKTCDVKSGYECTDGGTSCTTKIIASLCDENATFENGSCVCNSGWEGDGVKTGTYLGAANPTSTGCLRICDANATRKDKNTCECNSGYNGDGITCNENPKQISAADCVDGATFSNGKCNCPAGSFGDGLKPNESSPYCKYVPNDPTCTNQYDVSTGRGTQVPRGCIAQCNTGYYWGN